MMPLVQVIFSMSPGLRSADLAILAGMVIWWLFLTRTCSMVECADGATKLKES